MANFITELENWIFNMMHNMSGFIDEFFSIDGIVIFEPVLSNGHIGLCLFISIYCPVRVVEIDFLKYFCSSIIVFLGSVNFGNLLFDICVLNFNKVYANLPPLRMQYVYWHLCFLWRICQPREHYQD